MRVAGLMSGTSADGIDVAVVDLVPDGDVLGASLVALRSVAYPPAVRSAVEAALPPREVTARDWCVLDTVVGQAFAAAAAEVTAEVGAVELLVSHGQTVFHWVDGGEVRGTLQVGQPAWLAEVTGLPVVSDLRARDVAAGGQGAPLVSAFDVLWLGSRPGRPVALNLGGIANVTADLAGAPVAYDTGPANTLVDVAVGRLTDGAQAYDRDGERGARGVVDDRLLARMLADPYFARPAPKTTGRELFHGGWLDTALDGRRLDDDVIATLTALTARTVADAVRRHEATEVVAAGGGTRNPTLMAMLRAALGGTPVLTTDELGLPSGAKEAVAFAVLGYLTVHGHPSTVPSATGARHASLLGSVTPGVGGLPRPGRQEAPRSLVIGAATPA
ncbi:anhydro-N-acetylmuramic acid kinase [Oryzobacter telluris]|uniref:anhydro-N-acetylmuramic acid kinase n=1 Tax=Oryzobacter telluris TaxID=3149179 RepID=UPI00370D4A1A